MHKSIAISAVFAIFAGFTSSGTAATLFFDNDLAGFTAATTTSLTDFEGIVGPGEFSNQPTFTIDGNTYSNSTGASGVTVCGQFNCIGTPFDSSVMVADGFNGTLRIDLAGGISAVGGLFGDLDGPAGTGIISIFDSDGLHDSRAVNYGELGQGSAKSFFGWVSTDIFFTALEFSIALNGRWSATDDIRFGTTVSAIPLPAAFWLFSTALVGLVGISKRKNN